MLKSNSKPLSQNSEPDATPVAALSPNATTRQNSASPLPGKQLLMVINADTSRQPAFPADRSSERLADYTALKATLGGEVLDWQNIQASFGGRLLAKIAGKGSALAWLAFQRRSQHKIFYCDSENNGLLLAGLFKLSRTKKPLIMIGHWITPSKKAFLFRRLKSNITRLLLHSSTQYEKAQAQLGFSAQSLQLIPYQVDTEFWHPAQAHPASTERPYICTAGLEFRDYPTLIEAVRDLDIDLKIGAASHWSKRKDSTLSQNVSPRVEIRSYNYTELRDLYAGSKFVVVPLYDVDFQAGITLILEAMAMGKAVITTRSEGQGDTVIDRRLTTRHGPLRPTTGSFANLYGAPELEPTGFYVSCENAQELHRAIQHLLDHPQKALEMGQAGRQAVEKLMSVELFASRIQEVVLEALNSPR